MNYERALKKLKKQELAPGAGLWYRIEDTLTVRTARAVPYRLAFSAAALMVFAGLMFGGTEQYGHYRLEQYLLGAGGYPAQTEYFSGIIPGNF